MKFAINLISLFLLIMNDLMRVSVNASQEDVVSTDSLRSIPKGVKRNPKTAWIAYSVFTILKNDYDICCSK